MIQQVSTLSGAALNWAVAMCESQIVFWNGKDKALYCGNGKPNFMGYKGDHEYSPSTNWTQCGPIIEQESIFIVREKAGHLGRRLWAATSGRNQAVGISEESIKLYRDHFTFGPTPLIAAMRCYVTSKVGTIIEIPKELL